MPINPDADGKAGGPVARSWTARDALLYAVGIGAAGGFDKPVLRGPCTYGFTGRALRHSPCNGERIRFRSMNTWFSRPVPGDTLTVSMWADGERCALPHHQPELRGVDRPRALHVRMTVRA